MRGGREGRRGEGKDQAGKRHDRGHDQAVPKVQEQVCPQVNVDVDVDFKCGCRLYLLCNCAASLTDRAIYANDMMA